MRTLALDPHRLATWMAQAGGAVRGVLHWASRHTGLPAVFVAAVALVVSFRLFRRTVRFGVEVLVTLAALLVATRLGWVTW